MYVIGKIITIMMMIWPDEMDYCKRNSNDERTRKSTYEQRSDGKTTACAVRTPNSFALQDGRQACWLFQIDAFSSEWCMNIVN